jgi:HEAT repeat protein
VGAAIGCALIGAVWFIVGVLGEAQRSLQEPDTAALVTQLNSANAEDREQAAEGLRQLGPDAREAVPALTAALRDGDRRVRWTAARALWKVDRQAEPLLLIAAEAMGQDSLYGDFHFALLELGFDMHEVPLGLPFGIKGHLVSREDAEASVRGVVKALRHEDVRVRLLAVFLVQTAGGDAAEVAVPPLIQALEDEDPRVRCAVIQTLGKFGPKARAAAPQLKEVVRRNAPLRTGAAVALLAGAAQPFLAFPCLAEIVATLDAALQNAASAALKEIEPGAGDLDNR